MKIFGYNILTDEELNRQFKANFYKLASILLKTEKIYSIRLSYEFPPKCGHCDENRQILIDMPDGTKKKIDCSCRKDIEVYKIIELQCFNLHPNWGEEILIGDRYNYKKLIRNEEELSECCSIHNYYLTKELAEKAIEIIKIREAR